MRTYETQYPAQQDQPVSWFNNPIIGWGSTNFQIVDYMVTGYSDGQLWLQSKTGDSNDRISINWTSTQEIVAEFMVGKLFSFNGSLEYDHSARRWYIQWDNARTNKY